MLERILENVYVGQRKRNRNITVMVFSPQSGNDAIQDAIWEWLNGFYYQMLAPEVEKNPQSMKLALNEKKTNQTTTGYILKGLYAGMHKGIVLGFIEVRPLLGRDETRYLTQFRMKNRYSELRRPFYVDQTFSENDARGFSAWISRNILNQELSNYNSTANPKTL